MELSPLRTCETFYDRPNISHKTTLYSVIWNFHTVFLEMSVIAKASFNEHFFHDLAQLTLGSCLDETSTEYNKLVLFRDNC